MLRQVADMRWVMRWDFAVDQGLGLVRYGGITISAHSGPDKEASSYYRITRFSASLSPTFNGRREVRAVEGCCSLIPC